MPQVHFSSPFTADKVDPVNGVIHGVSVITGGVTARGHELEVDDTTLQQMLLCARAKKRVPVKVDHKSGAGAVCGFLTNFEIKGQKLVADWNLLNTHPQRDQIIEAAERMPEGIGLSAAFVAPEGEFFSRSGKKAARCEELISVDYVALPAANPNGLFSARVDTLQPTMNQPSNAPTGEPSLADVLAAITSINSRLDAYDARFSKQDEEAQAAELAQQPLTLEEASQMTDEQLAQVGLTRAEVDAAVEAALGADGPEGSAEGLPSDSGPEGAEAGAPAAAGAGTALSALNKRVTELQAQLTALRGDAVRSQEETLFEAIEAKVEALHQENEALRHTLFAAGQPVAPGVERHNVRYFSAGKQEGAYENMVAEAMDADPKLTRFQAFKQVRSQNPEAYKEFLARSNVISLGQ